MRFELIEAFENVTQRLVPGNGTRTSNQNIVSGEIYRATVDANHDGIGEFMEYSLTGSATFGGGASNTGTFHGRLEYKASGEISWDLITEFQAIDSVASSTATPESFKKMPENINGVFGLFEQEIRFPFQIRIQGTCQLTGSSTSVSFVIDSTSGCFIAGNIED